MKQEAEKIYNIEHADNVNFDVSGLFETVEKLNQAIDRIPELIDSTIAMFPKYDSNRLLVDTVTMDSRGLFTPVSLRSKQEETYSIGDIVMSHWQLDQYIGKGSFSTVYEAHHTGHGHDGLYKSAIKVVNSVLLSSPISEDTDITQYDFNASSMIQQELDNMVELRGTGYIVDYEDHETVTYSNGSWGIIIRMELLQPLSDTLQSKQMSRDAIIRLGIDICKALEFCNKSNIIHRDVKPSNIFITKWGGYKLGDFGAAIKITDSQNQDRMGTLKYMAPEVYCGKPYSPNIDTYSLGLVLYELLKTNQKNDLAAKEAALSKRLSGAPLPPIPGVDKRLLSIILKACSYKPEDRFSSPTEMLNELLKLKLNEKLHTRWKRWC